MTRWFTKAFSLIVVLSITHLAACGGGQDLPFAFGDGSDGGSGSESPPPPGGGSSCSADTDCTGGKVCNATTHTCENPSSGCDDNSDCTAPQTCNLTTHTCQNPPSGGCNSDTECPSGQVCNTTSHACELPGACAVDFNATLTLKIDDNDSDFQGHFDSPSKCCEYAGVGGSDVDELGNPMCPLPPGSPNLDHFLQDPSENTDLYCCSQASEAAGSSVSGHPELFCDVENRHDGAPELAATRWPAHLGGKIRLKFAITNGGANCQVALVRDLFPQFRLENTALDASIVIDAGKDYQTLPPNPSDQLNPDEITASCTVTTDGGGNFSVAIPSLRLRFMTQLYENFIKCTQVDDNGSNCSSGPFTRRYLEDNPATPGVNESAGSIQIIRGFNDPALTLTTGPSTASPTNPANQAGPMTLQGDPLHYDAVEDETKLTLVTAFAMSPNTSTVRDDATGTGQLLAELGNALLTAEIRGTVTKTDGQPIQTLADLTNCGSGGGGGTGNRLELTMSSTFNMVTDNLTVTGNPTALSEPFTAEACIPGGHAGAPCATVSPALLPFAKDVAAGDPVAGAESKFIKEGTLVIQSAGASTATMTLQVPETAGAFRIVNAAALQNVPLAPGNSQTLNVRFAPETSAAGCTTTGGVVNCQASLTLSSSHNVTVTLKGTAKPPAAELRLEEIGAAAPNAAVGTLLPAASVPTVAFEETILGGQTRTKLYKVTNSGVRNLVINGIQAQDVQRNFRLGSVYQGADFASRVWKVGMNPWTITPAANSQFFAWLNYGPFGKVTGGGDTRADSGTLVVDTSAGVATVNLTGTAKKDTRAALALYVEDPNRFTVTGAGDPDLKTVTDGAETRRLYLARNLLWSFRQDSTPRVAYVFNNAAAANVDNLVLTHLKFNPDAGPKLAFTPDANPQTTACLAAAEAATVACATLTPTGDTSGLKLGTITFTPSAGGSYSVTEGSLVVKAYSRPLVGSGDGAPPKIAGHNTIPASPVVTYGMKGANGAPSGTFDLKIHRLIAGFSNKINQGLQKTLIVSGSTKGILQRFNNQPGTDVDLNQLKEVFTLQNGIELNAETGQATLKKIVTTTNGVIGVDPDPNNPVSPSNPLFSGLRLYNAPGSLPPRTEYFAECITTPTPPGHSCAFFYLYIGDWAGSTTQLPASGVPPSCQNKFPVVQYTGTTPDQLTDQYNTVLKPDDATEFGCMSDGLRDKTDGLYDPVTGEIIFNDLAVRLYAPNVPQLTDSDVDATIRLSLTTGCVRQDLVPDTTARGQYLVPHDTLNDTKFNATLMPNTPPFPLTPLHPFVDLAGASCVPRELHGRPMFGTDTTYTLDNDTDSDDLNFGGFDLAGVGRNVTNSPSVRQSNMYIVIKAEVLPP